MNTNETVLVTGSTGLVGRAISKCLRAQGFTDVWGASGREVDFRDQAATHWYFSEVKPAYVFHCAAKVGGIAANIASPADFMVQNLMIQTNVLTSAHYFRVKKLLFLASAAVYPDSATNPLSPSALMSGPFDETKSGYAMAKLAGIQMCKEFRKQYGDDFISAIPNNVYGPGDRSSHVIPDLLRRFHVAKKQSEVATCWGTGKARREFIYVDDLAEACLFLMDNYSGPDPMNVGVGDDSSMMELATIISEVVGYEGRIDWDSSKPEGTRQRLLDSSALNAHGWRARTCLIDGLKNTYIDLCQKLHL